MQLDARAVVASSGKQAYQNPEMHKSSCLCIGNKWMQCSSALCRTNKIHQISEPPILYAPTFSSPVTLTFRHQSFKQYHKKRLLRPAGIDVVSS